MQHVRLGVLISTIFVLLFLSGCMQERKNTRPWVDIEKINESLSKDAKALPSNLNEVDAKKGEKPEKIKTFSVTEGANPLLKGVQRSEKEPTGSEGEGILLNFDNAEIYEVIQSIAEILSLNYIIDPQVKGVVNIRSGKKIPLNQLMTVFQKILHINGLDIRSEGDYQYIYAARQPAFHFIRGPEQIGGLQDSPKMVMQIVPVMYLSVAEGRKLVEPYLSDHGVIYDLQNQNTLIIVDFESKIIDCVTILAQLDVSPLSNLKINLVRIENAPLFDLRDELEEILKAMRVNQTDFTGVSVTALERVNSLLLVSNNEALLETVLKWVSELDRSQMEGGDTIYIYNVRNCVSSELAELVNSLIGEAGAGGQGGAAGGTKKTSSKKVSPKSSSSTPRTSSPSSLMTSRTGQRSGGGGASPMTQQHPGGADATSQQQGVKSFQMGGDSSAMQFTKEPLLISDDSRNVILIRAVPSDYTRILKVLERLDNVPRQVLIETMVAEVTLTDNFSLGIEWALKNKDMSILGNAVQSIVTKTGTGTADDKTSAGYFYSINSNPDDDGYLFLNALATQTDFTVLSSPHVLVLNNETATVNIGSEVPIVTSETTQNNTSTTNPANNAVDRSIQYKDTGIILTVTPRINYNGMITLEIEQEISDASKQVLISTTTPVINKKQVKTKLAVKNGQSILIGGLITKNKTINENGVPLLKDIPWLGYLFKKYEDNTERKELLLMITPYVIETEEVLDQYIKNFKGHVDSLRKDMRE